MVYLRPLLPRSRPPPEEEPLLRLPESCLLLEGERSEADRPEDEPLDSRTAGVVERCGLLMLGEVGDDELPGWP